jgi:hypothetical protein
MDQALAGWADVQAADYAAIGINPDPLALCAWLPGAVVKHGVFAAPHVGERTVLIASSSDFPY